MNGIAQVAGLGRVRVPQPERGKPCDWVAVGLQPNNVTFANVLIVANFNYREKESGVKNANGAFC